MEMIATGTKCKLSVVPAGTTLYDQYKDKEFTATEKVGAGGNQQFTVDGAKCIYANNGNGFLIEPIEA